MGQRNLLKAEIRRAFALRLNSSGYEITSKPFTGHKFATEKYKLSEQSDNKIASSMIEELVHEHRDGRIKFYCARVPEDGCVPFDLLEEGEGLNVSVWATFPMHRKWTSVEHWVLHSRFRAKRAKTACPSCGLDTLPPPTTIGTSLHFWCPQCENSVMLNAVTGDLAW